jgi:hypothetical protein
MDTDGHGFLFRRHGHLNRRGDALHEFVHVFFPRRVIGDRIIGRGFEQQDIVLGVFGLPGNFFGSTTSVTPCIP